MERSPKLTSPARRALVLAALALAATMAGSAQAGALGSAATPPVELPNLPEVPQLPSVPTPAVPTPEVPAPPSLPAPSVPSPGGASGVVTGGSSAPGTGSLGEPGSGVVSVGPTVSATGDAGARPRRQAARRAARERRLRRKVRRLAPCLDAVSSLERRVLVLRAGLGRHRTHSRAATARRLRISVRRASRAERRGLGRLRRANSATGCGRGGRPANYAGPLAAAVVNAPLLAQVLDVRAALVAKGPAPRAPKDSAAVKGAVATPELAGLPATGAATAGDPGAVFPVVVLLALLAVALGSAVILRGRRLADEVMYRRAERATDQRQKELIEAVKRILGERQHR